MRCVPTKEEEELVEKVRPYFVYPPINGYSIRPDSPKEIFEAVDELRNLHKKIIEEIS